MPRVLATPGVVGRSVRLALAVAFGWLGDTTAREARVFFHGIDPAPALAIVGLVLASSRVVSERVHKAWAQIPLVVMLAGAGIAAGAHLGGALSPPRGTYGRGWTMCVVLLLRPGLLLAATWRHQPVGCGSTPVSECVCAAKWMRWHVLGGSSASTTCV